MITVGSLSKLAWGGLRIGWIRAPRADIDRLVAGKIVADHSTSLITQAIAARVLDRVDEVAGRTRTAAAERRSIVTEALSARLPEWQWIDAGGWSVPVGPPARRRCGGSSAASLRDTASSCDPVRSRHPTGASATTSVSPTVPSPNGLTEAVERLAAAWADIRPGDPPRSEGIAGRQRLVRQPPGSAEAGIAPRWCGGAPPWGNCKTGAVGDG